jgi:ATP-dependent exoDNAse (exonuclease V) beta subunit
MKVKEKFDKVIKKIADENLSEVYMDLMIMEIIKNLAEEYLSEKNNDKIVTFLDNLKQEIGEEEFDETP